jgi:hypothetical protein
MTELPAEKQAAKAIAHTLRNISERPGVAWYLGHGTQTYALLTEAHATLHGITMEKAQENWPPADQPKFEGDALNQCPFCGSNYLKAIEDDDRHFIECGDCKTTGPIVEDFLCDDDAGPASAARRKWNERTMPR